MESFPCEAPFKNGINTLKLMGNTVMNKAQNLLLSGTLTISSIFAMNAQSNDNGDTRLAMNTKTPAKTEMTSAEMDARTPVVREGKFSDALNLSAEEDMIVVYISGAKGSAKNPEKYTAKQYAEILQKAFANSKYTDHPTDIVVIYRETGEDGVSTASVLIDGEEYTTKSGRTVFTPMMIGRAIDVFADAYAKKMGVVYHAPKPSNTGQGLALNNDR